MSEHDQDPERDALAPHEIAEALEEPSELDFEGVPEPVIELCQACVEYVRRAVGIEPDYTPETLPLVEHYAHQVRESLAGRPEALPLVAQAVGAYFGEVARRALSCFWRIPSPNYHDWQLCGRAAFLAINPIGVGYDLMLGNDEHQGPRSVLRVAPEDREAVAQRLAQLPEVTEEEYVNLGTRLEVLEVAMEAVRAEQSRRGYEDAEFSEDDYRAELRPIGMA